MSFNEIMQFGIWSKIAVNIPLLVVGYLLCAAVGYLLGGLNFGLIISKLKFGEDVRTQGSGNAGMTNMMRVYGTKAAAFTLLGDVLKTVFAVIIGYLVYGEVGAYCAALGCIFGHAYPVYFGFKGGKGVAVSAAMILCLSPLTFIILFILFAGIVASTKYISLGSIMCMLVYPLLLSRMSGVGPHIIIALVAALLVIYLHRSNIKRLLSGTENKFSFKKSKESKPKNNSNDKEGE